MTGAHRHDVTQLLPLLEAIPPVRGKRGRPRRRPHRVQGDRGDDAEPHRQGLRERTAEIAERWEVLVLDDDPERQLRPLGEVRPDELCLVGARHIDQLVQQPRRGKMPERAEQQIEARQIVAVVASADLERQKGTSLVVGQPLNAAAPAQVSRLPIAIREEIDGRLVVLRVPVRVDFVVASKRSSEDGGHGPADQLSPSPTGPPRRRVPISACAWSSRRPPPRRP